MRPTYYEQTLADKASPLATILDEEISRLSARGEIRPDPEDTEFANGLARYLKQALENYKLSLARDSSDYQFELFQQTPAYQEAMMQMAANQYWTYETFFYFKALGERTIRVSPETARELLEAPLQARASELQMPAAAMMLVFEGPEMVDALYAGERRHAPGRNDYNAYVYVFAVEVPPSEGFATRRLKLLSVHSGPHANHRIEVRRLLLQEDLPLEEILKMDWGKTAKGPSEVKHAASDSAAKPAGAARGENYGFYGARVPYYRAVAGALLKACQQPGQPVSPQRAAAGQARSRLSYVEI